MIKSLKSGKAADQDGICTEQLKMAPGEIAHVLQPILQNILDEANIPQSLKTGYKIPIPKAGKDLLECNNYRGITITALFGKILEMIILDRVATYIETGASEL